MVAKRIPDDAIVAILKVVGQHADAVTAAAILHVLPEAMALRTLQYRLRRLVDGQRLFAEARGRWASLTHSSFAIEVNCASYWVISFATVLDAGMPLITSMPGAQTGLILQITNASLKSPRWN